LSDYIIDEDVQKAIDAINARVPVVYIAGKAGSGKSSLIKYLTQTLNREYALLSTTGISAMQIGGQTVNSFFWIPPRMIHESEIKNRNDDTIKKLDLIIIDEISMMRADSLDVCDKSLRKWKRINRPFADVQIVLVGDLFQLAPIVGKADEAVFYDLYESPFFFSANVFKEVDVETIELRTVYRQKDPEFLAALNNIRTKTNLKETLAYINKNCYKKASDDMLTLAPTNKIIDQINLEGLAKIKSQEFEYVGVKMGKFGLDGDKLPAPEHLVLKVGAKVMITKNGEFAVNGDIAVVEGCGQNYVDVRLASNGLLVKLNKTKWEAFEYSYDKESKHIEAHVTGTYTQIPLTLCYGLTVHKCQGLTLQEAKLNLGNYVFAPGLTYVGLSRITDMKNLRLVNPIRERDIIIDDRIIAFYKMNVEKEDTPNEPIR